MRSILIVFVCFGALVGGVLLAVVCAQHPAEIAQMMTTGGSIVDAVTASPAPSESGWHNNVWTPPRGAPPAHPNWTWHLTGGKTYENVVITNVSSTEVTISHSLGVAHLPLDSLPPDVQNELQYTPQAPPPAPPSATSARPAPAPELTAVAAMVDKRLVDLHGQPVPTPGPEVKYYAIYYSAGWCPPCKTFTPSLVEWYRGFKPNHPDFELIFVSQDHSEADMFAYMGEAQMPWPAVAYSEVQTGGAPIEKYEGSGIPDLVLVDSSGKVLADTFVNGDYHGPQSVVNYIDANLSAN